MKKKEGSGWRNFVPITKWLPSYNIKENLINDLIGGITVGILHVPQGMAYASLVGLKPVYGLYTSLFPSLIYMFLVPADMFHSIVMGLIKANYLISYLSDQVLRT
uniref:Sulfate_transp domain-containing protein n=1 Tax=Caenorhabditis tropicalis TaxID=1561998 RepID=A0A1I7T5P9_9PELO